MIIPVMVKGKPNAEKKRCFDCYHCQGAHRWWCVNKEAVDYRGTARPGVHSCHFRKPVQVYSDLTFWERINFKLSLFSIAIEGDE